MFKRRSTSILYTGIAAAFILGVFGIVFASFNEQINYQGKLTDGDNVAVSDGDYCMKFLIHTAATEDASIWSEEWKEVTSKISTVSGLFSTLLGTHSSLSSVDFNQDPLYLEVQFDPGCDATYEEAFAPRKRLGAVPAAIEAKQLGGKTWAEPDSIGLTTPAAGAFAALSASSTFTTSNGSILSSATGELTFGGTGGSYDENLTMDFESTENTVTFGTGTGVTDLDFDSLSLTTTGNITIDSDTSKLYLGDTQQGEIFVDSNDDIYIKSIASQKDIYFQTYASELTYTLLHLDGGILGVALGRNTSATGIYGLAAGYDTIASANYSTAIGSNFENSTASSVALGISDIDLLITTGLADFQDTAITTSGDIRLVSDSNKLEIGGLAGGDLQLYHDGTDSYITTATGDLKFTAASGTIDFDNENLTTTGTGSFNALTLTGDTSVISSAYEIDIKPNDDADDYIRFDTVEGITRMQAVGGDLYLFGASNVVIPTGSLTISAGNLTVTGTLDVTGDTQLGNSTTADTVGINVAPDANNLITASFSETGANTAANYFLKGTFADSGDFTSADTYNDYGYYLDFDVSNTLNFTGDTLIHNVYGSYIDLESTSDLRPAYGGSHQFLYGYYADVFWNGTFIQSNSGAEVYVYGGYFSGTGKEIAESTLQHDTYGIKVVSAGDLGTTAVTKHYGAFISVTGTADTNYGLWIDVVGGTANDGIVIDSDNVAIRLGETQGDFDLYSDGTNAQIDASGAFDLTTSGDTDDYITFTTSGNVPIIGTAGTADLKITASSGEIDLDDENLTTTGDIRLLSDSNKLEIGGASGGDLTIYHDGTDSYITTATGDLKFTADSGEIDFSDENLTTTGTLGAGSTTVTGDLDVTGDTQLGDSNTADTVGINIAPNANNLITADFSETGANTAANYFLKGTFADSGDFTSADTYNDYGYYLDFDVSNTLNFTGDTLIHNVYGSYIDLESTSDLRPAYGGSHQFLYGYYADVFWNGTFIQSNSGAEVYVYGGYFSGTGKEIAESTLQHDTYGIKVVSAGDLGTTAVTKHYGAFISVTGTADTNYGLWIDVVGGTANDGIVIDSDNVAIRLGETQGDFDLYSDGTNGQIDTSGAFDLTTSGDTDDYITFTTSANVPIIGTVGTADLKITASSGVINFDDENLTTTGDIRLVSDSNKLEIGAASGGDLTIYHDGTDSYITTATGDLKFTADSGEIDFSDENLTTTGDFTVDNMDVDGSITMDASETVDGVDISLISLSSQPVAISGNVDFGDYDLTSIDKLEGYDSGVFIDLGANGRLIFSADGTGSPFATPDMDFTGSAYIDDDWGIALDKKLMFGDADVYVFSDDNGYLDLVADTGIRLSGATAITGALTATSYGGITEANLVDLTDNETITGAWTFSDLVTIDAIPSGTGVSQGSLYINPASATADYTLFGVALDGAERFRIDEDGDITAAGTITAGSSITIDGSNQKLTTSDGYLSLSATEDLKFDLTGGTANTLTLSSTTDVATMDFSAFNLTTTGTGTFGNLANDGTITTEQLVITEYIDAVNNTLTTYTNTLTFDTGLLELSGCPLVSNSLIRLNTYITAADAIKYIQWQVKDSSDMLELTREDSNILGFKIDMPVNLVDNDLSLNADNAKLLLGAAATGDASIYYDATDLVINTALQGSGALNLFTSGDTDDYITFTTSGNVPIIGTAGTADLKITASSGTVNFDDENLTTTGIITQGHLKLLERSSDPSEPATGEAVIWVSDGTGKGDDGDVLVASNIGGDANWGTLFDHSGGAGFDIAEFYGSHDSTLEGGDVVVIDETYNSGNPSGQSDSKIYVKKSSSSYESSLVGIVSTKPFQSFGDNFDETENPRPVALVGRVPVKVSSENGPIEIGDWLTSSTTPGVAMKATKTGPTIGKALESYVSNGIGKIMAFVNIGWYGGSLNEDGSMGGGIAINSSFIGKVKTILSSLGLAIEDGVAFIRDLTVEKLTVKDTMRINKMEMVDQATGQVYCTWIENGEWIKTQGGCNKIEGCMDSTALNYNSDANVDDNSCQYLEPEKCDSEHLDLCNTQELCEVVNLYWYVGGCHLESEQICEEGATQQCGTSDVGVCQFGIQTCLDNNWGECAGAVEAVSEICDDDIDNDCDGSIDTDDEDCQTTPPPPPVCDSEHLDLCDSQGLCEAATLYWNSDIGTCTYTTSTPVGI